MATLEELRKQRETYQSLIPTVSGDTQQRLLQAVEATNKRIMDMEAAEPAPVLDPTPALQAQQPVEVPQVPVTPIPESIPQLTPQGGISVVDRETQEAVIPAPSAQTPEPEVVSPEPTPLTEEGPRVVSLADIEAPARPTTTQPGAAIPISQTTQTSVKAGLEIPQEIKDSISAPLQAESELAASQQEFQRLGSEQQKVLEGQSALLTAEAEERRKRQENFFKDLEAKTKIIDDEAAALSKEKIDSRRFWKNQDTGTKIANSLFVILGGLGSALSGNQTNSALNILLKAADDDVKDQVANLENRKSMNKAQRTALKDTMNRFSTQEAGELAVLNTKLKAMDQKLAGYEAKAKTEAQKSNLAIARGRLEQEVKNNQLKIVQLEAPQVTTSTVTQALTPEGAAAKAAKGKKPQKFTQDETKAAGFASRMATAEKDLNESLKGTDPTGIISGGFQGMLPNVLKGEARQRFEQAQRNFITAVLRKESGAVIGADEFETERQKYFPVPGDSEEVLAQKAESRRQAIQSMQTAAGAALQPQEGTGKSKARQRFGQ